MSMLSLEIEKEAPFSENVTQTHNDRLSLIINFIKNNIKNPSLDLSMVAKYFGLSERMIQYILNGRGIKFHNLLSSERCLFLESKIRSDKFADVNVAIIDSGFESITTACRQFKSFYKMTPRQYQQNLKS